MIETLTTRDLCDTRLISDDEVDMAVDAFMANPMTPPHVFREGYRLNVAKAVRRHPGANANANRPELSPQLKRPFVRVAILEACPVRE